MKKISLSTILFFLFATLTMAQQVDKTKLSTDIQARYQKNLTELSQYTWQRETEIIINNVVQYTSTSAVSIGPDGKIVVQVIEKKSKLQEEPGNDGQEEELRNYVENALSLVSGYIFMNKDKMIELFNKGTVSELNDNYRVQAFNFLVEGDNLNFLYKRNTLDCVNQAVNTKMKGDDVKAIIEYRIFNGMFMVKKISLELPAKNMHATAVNSEWSKKI